MAKKTSLSAGQKAARTRKRKVAAKKAVTTKKRRKTARKAVETKRWQAIRTAAEAALAAINVGDYDKAKVDIEDVLKRCR